jgi:hypothetical protein
MCALGGEGWEACKRASLVEAQGRRGYANQLKEHKGAQESQGAEGEASVKERMCAAVEVGGSWRGYVKFN